MVKKRTHIVIPATVVAEIDSLVGKRGRSRFLTEIATQEVKRLRLLRALERPGPAWKDKDHLELKAGRQPGSVSFGARTTSAFEESRTAERMAIYLLDSDVIIDALNHKRGRRELLLGLAMERHVLACCSVQVTEVYAGTKPEDQVRTEELLAGLEFYEVDRETARKAGRLRRDHARRGVTLSLADATIAAVALSHHLTLITGNVKDYPMPELKLYR